MDLAYVCEWEKKPKSNHCPSIPLVCAWSCRNLIAFTTDLRNEEEKGTACLSGNLSCKLPVLSGKFRIRWAGALPCPDSCRLLLLVFLPPLSLWQCLTHVCSRGVGLVPLNQDQAHVGVWPIPEFQAQLLRYPR